MQFSTHKGEIFGKIIDGRPVFDEKSMAFRDLKVEKGSDFIAECMNVLMVKNGQKVKLTLELVEDHE